MYNIECQQPNKRKNWLDAIKGVAIILVVCSHTQQVPYVHTYLTACYMCLFFIASGYTYKSNSGAIKKCKQLLLPYFAWSLVYLLTEMIRITVKNYSYKYISIKAAGILYSRVSPFPLTPENTSFIFPPGAEPLWFLTCMSVSYVLFTPLLNKKRVLWLIPLYLLISALLVDCPILLPWSIDTAFLGALFLLGGYNLKSVSFTNRKIFIFFITCCISYIGIVYFNGDTNMSIRNYGHYGITSMFCFIALGFLGTISYSSMFMLIEQSRICRFFAYFGRMSLVIMCAHMLFAMVYQKIVITSSLFSFVPIEVRNSLWLPFIFLGCICTHKIQQHLKSNL